MRGTARDRQRRRGPKIESGRAAVTPAVSSVDQSRACTRACFRRRLSSAAPAFSRHNAPHRQQQQRMNSIADRKNDSARAGLGQHGRPHPVDGCHRLQRGRQRGPQRRTRGCRLCRERRDVIRQALAAVADDGRRLRHCCDLCGAAPLSAAVQRVVNLASQPERRSVRGVSMRQSWAGGAVCSPCCVELRQRPHARAVAARRVDRVVHSRLAQRVCALSSGSRASEQYVCNSCPLLAARLRP